MFHIESPYLNTKTTRIRPKGSVIIVQTLVHFTLRGEGKQGHRRGEERERGARSSLRAVTIR